MNTIVRQSGLSSFELITAKDQQTWVDVDRDDILAGFKNHGAVVFRGFSGGLDEFVTFTKYFCNSFMLNNTPSRNFVSKARDVQTVDLGDRAFPLHAERSQSPIKPDIAFFYCRKAPLSGGRTCFCDGALLASSLPDTRRRELEARGLLYVGSLPESNVMDLLEITDREQLLPAIEERGLGHVYFYKGDMLCMKYLAPFLAKSKFGGELVFVNFLLFARYLQNNTKFPLYENGSEVPAELVAEISQVADSMTVWHEWQSNDLLMLDNTRVLHGREQLDNVVGKRDILTRFGYASFS